MSDWDDDADVGYGRPPKWTRFEKGKSGNPKGRPRKQAKPKQLQVGGQTDEVLRRELARKVKIKEGGATRTVSTLEVIQKSQLKSAAGGNSLAQREILKSARALDAQQAQAAEARAEAEQATLAQDRVDQERLFHYFARLKRERAAEWDAALAAGRTEPDFPWPHPDDILIDASRRRYSLRGPMEAADVSYYFWIRSLRDLNIAVTMRYLRSEEAPEQALAQVYTQIWLSFDVLLPKRWQLLDKMDAAIWEMYQMPAEELDRLIASREAEVASLAAIHETAEPKKEGYKSANKLLGPILKRKGYRSLAQFERAWQATNGDPPWPRLR